MVQIRKKSDDIAVYIEDREYLANTYVLRCFFITMLVYTVTFLLNLVGIFVIDQKLMLQGYIPSLLVYFIVFFASRKVSLSDGRTKYFILFGVILVFTIAGVSITYHVVLASLLPFLYATLYSSRQVMRYVYALTVVSTIVIVYGGYFWGLCDANMVLLTTRRVQDYVSDGQFLLTQVGESPYFSLFLFFVLPRCIIYIAFGYVCSNIYNIVSGSLEKAKLTAELEKAKTEAENANRAKSQFLAKMSHEIRTPINAVLGMNEMILRESHEEDVRKYACDIKDSSKVLLDIVNELLDSSKIESGKMELIPVNYEIGSFLNDLYNMIDIKAKEKNLTLQFVIDPAIPSEYYGDDRRISQVLLNLLTNAVKYTNQGSVTLTLTGRVEGDTAVLHYSVKDTGIGIKPEDMGKLHDAFARIDMSRNRYVEGTGLGMSIVEQLLQLMGSRLKIQSEYGKGSEFSFAIEQKIVDVHPLGNFGERLQKSLGEQECRVDFIAPKAKVLVVDDNKINLKVFRGLLKPAEIQVYEAESGEMCLDILRQQSFDMIFLDYMMPDMDGIETFHKIRDGRLCEGVPIIMLTANAVIGEKENCLQEGFDDFLAKPIMPDKLDKMLLRYLPKELVVISDHTKQGSVPANGEDVLKEIHARLPELDLEKGLATCSRDVDFYLELLKDFTELTILEELSGYFRESDHKNYCIRIHGFKNNAYSVGATAIGDLAYKMEQSSREGLSETLRKMQERLGEQYERICVQYREIMEN
ncbi:MAG: response regulator [Lachnospiraceae bacterium]|nr:response regulator [Lachnospiraceae bacterium]